MTGRGTIIALGLALALAAPAGVAAAAQADLFPPVAADLREPAEAETAEMNRVAAEMEAAREAGSFDAAARLADELGVLVEATYGPDHPVAADLMTQRARTDLARGDYAAAAAGFEAALELRRRRLPDGHPDLAEGLNNLGSIYGYVGRYAEAEPLLRQAVAIWTETLGPEAADTLQARFNLAFNMLDQGRYPEGASEARAVAEVQRRLDPRGAGLAETLTLLGQLTEFGGDAVAAEPVLREALEIRLEVAGADSSAAAISMNALAGVLRYLGRLPEAEALLLRAVAIWEEGLGPDHPFTDAGLHHLGLVIGSQGRHEEAVALFAPLLAGREARLGAEHPETLQTAAALASVYVAQGRALEAEPLHRRVLDSYATGLGEAHPLTHSAHDRMGDILLAQGRAGEAVEQFRRAMELRTAHAPENRGYQAESAVGLARALDLLGDGEGAERQWLDALDMRREALPPGHPDLALTLGGAGRQALRNGRPGDALDRLRRAEAALLEAAPARSGRAWRGRGGLTPAAVIFRPRVDAAWAAAATP